MLLVGVALVAATLLGACVETLECDINTPCKGGTFCYRGFCEPGCDENLDDPTGLATCTVAARSCRPCDDNCAVDPNTNRNTLVCSPCTCTPRCDDDELCVSGACIPTLLNAAELDANGEPLGVDQRCTVLADQLLSNDAMCWIIPDEEPPSCPEGCLNEDGACCDTTAQTFCCPCLGAVSSLNVDSNCTPLAPGATECPLTASCGADSDELCCALTTVSACVANSCATMVSPLGSSAAPEPERLYCISEFCVSDEDFLSSDVCDGLLIPR